MLKETYSIEYDPKYGQQRFKEDCYVVCTVEFIFVHNQWSVFEL